MINKAPKIKFGQYTLSQLSGGDRFYFAGDRSKKVFTLSSSTPFEKRVQQGWTKYYANCYPDGSQVSEWHLDSRRVIFLRNQNDKQ